MIKKIIITLICIFALPILVYADSAGPESYQYDVIVTNPNGIVLEKYDGTKVTVPYDTKLTVVFEMSKDGELYLDVYYEDAYGSIKSSDVKVFNEEIDYNLLYTNDYGEQYYTVGNVEMYKGPSTMYGKSGKIIPKGVTLDYDYTDSVWTKVKYDGVEGWIFTYNYSSISSLIDCNVVSVETDNRSVLIIQNETSVYEDHKHTKLLGTIPAGEYEIKYYTSLKMHDNVYYIESDEISGWIKYEDDFDMETYKPIVSKMATSINMRIIALDGIELYVYENYNDDKPLEGIVIPAYTTLKTRYSINLKINPVDVERGQYNNDMAYQVLYKDKYYWIKVKDKTISKSYAETKIKVIKEATLYKNYEKSDVLTTIPAGTEISYMFTKTDVNYDLYAFVEYNGQKGWLNLHKSEIEYIETISFLDEGSLQPSTPTTPETPTEPAKPEEKKKLTGLQIGLICGGAAIVATLTAIVSIVLVNKKKKNKKEESVVAVEPKEETKTTDNEIKVPSTTGVLPVVNEEDKKDEE